MGFWRSAVLDRMGKMFQDLQEMGSYPDPILKNPVDPV